MNKKSTGKRIAIYLAFTFMVTYLLEIFLICDLAQRPELSMVSNLIIGSVMLIPSLGVVFTRLVTKEGFKDAWILPNFKGHIRYYILAWLLPSGLIIAGTILCFLIYPNMFDPNMGYMSEQYAVQGLTLDSTMIKSMAILQAAVAVVLSPILNIITTTGEEWGWRGYLVPKLSEKLSIVPTILISGVIWGLWHAPLTVMLGHNYGFGYFGYPYTGILAMCAFCIVVGAFFSYVALRTRSCLPAAIGHGALNGMASIGVMFMPSADSVNPFVGPMPTGIIGGVGFIIVMVVYMVVMVRLEKKNELIAPPKASKIPQVNVSEPNAAV